MDIGTKKSIIIGPYINWGGVQYIPSHRISYIEFGDPNNKNIIICAHGLTRNAHDFDKLARELSNKFRVISIDYPGRGDSEYFKEKKHYNYQVYVKDTILFLKKLHIKQVTWLGTSMGGIIGMVLASKCKDILKALIINDVGPFIPSSPLIKISQYARQTHVFNNLSHAKQHLKIIYSQFGISDEEDWDYMTKHSFVMNSEGKYIMNYDTKIVYSNSKLPSSKPKGVDIWAIWNKINCKLLTIHGVKSDILLQSTIKKMQASKRLDLYVVNDSGHAPALVNYDQIHYIQSWLDKIYA